MEDWAGRQNCPAKLYISPFAAKLTSRMSRYIVIFALVLAAEIVFALPFHTARFFRPTLLEVFGFTNTQLGDLFAVYGITAMLAYFPGGALADRFSARFLLTASLVMTAAGGLYMATIPGVWPMATLYGYWGMTSIFLLWGALIRATREWGGQSSQGTAFGILEAGRGLVAAGVAALMVSVLVWYLPHNVAMTTDAERLAGFRMVILIYSGITFAAGLLTWLAVPEVNGDNEHARRPLANMSLVLQRPIIWAQAAVIICAYCGFKGLDNYSLYAVQVLGMDEVQAAKLSTYGASLRPVAAIATGLIADRFDAARSLGVTFTVLVAAYFVLSIAAPSDKLIIIIYGNLFITFFAVFALRAIYFALLQENRTPRFLTGAAVGMISLVGFTPEIFFAPLTGRILDANPGLVGFQHFFLLLAAIATAGIAAIGWILWLRRGGPQKLWRP